MLRFVLLFFPLFLAQPALSQSESEDAEEETGAEAAPAKSGMSVDEQIEAIESEPAKKHKTAPIPLPPPKESRKKTESEKTAAPAKDEEDDNKFLGLDFTQPIGAKHSWYRGSGEWIASRTVREGLVGDEPVSKILTDGKRFDVSIGKRIPIFTFNEESLTRAWSAGFDGGMAVSLFRNKNRANNVSFASENFDGFFGAYIARAMDDTIVMYRLGHISAHLVDNNPRVITAIPYSRFWNEIIVSQTLASVTEASNWDLHLQGALGLNFKSEPVKSNPRWLFGMDFGRKLGGPNSYALVATVDVRHSGVRNQKNNYSAFFGIGRLRRPESANRPVKFGVSHHWGSDYRNQYYNRKAKFTAFEIQAEL